MNDAASLFSACLALWKDTYTIDMEPMVVVPAIVCKPSVHVPIPTVLIDLCLHLPDQRRFSVYSIIDNDKVIDAANELCSIALRAVARDHPLVVPYALPTRTRPSLRNTTYHATVLLHPDFAEWVSYALLFRKRRVRFIQLFDRSWGARPARHPHCRNYTRELLGDLPAERYVSAMMQVCHGVIVKIELDALESLPGDAQRRHDIFLVLPAGDTTSVTHPSTRCTVKTVTSVKELEASLCLSLKK